MKIIRCKNRKLARGTRTRINSASSDRGAPDQFSFIGPGGAPDLVEICENLASCSQGDAGLGCMEPRQWAMSLSRQRTFVEGAMTLGDTNTLGSRCVTEVFKLECLFNFDGNPLQR